VQIDEHLDTDGRSLGLESRRERSFSGEGIDVGRAREVLVDPVGGVRQGERQ
jgi:hypothetical protein